jgi:bacterioferritin-associated ferredoxin
MILCSCNVISDRDVRSAREDGAGRTRDVFKHCGRAPKCGKCIHGIRRELEQGVMNSAEEAVLDTCETACA